NCWTANATRSRTCSVSATSVALNSTSRPSSAATAAPSSRLMSAMTTRAPAATNFSTEARPIPEAPPVTMATFPDSSLSIVLTTFPLPGDREFVDAEGECVVLVLELVQAGGDLESGDALVEGAVDDLQLNPRELLADALVDAEPESVRLPGLPVQ